MIAPRASSSRPPITRRHALYPMLVLYAVVGLMFGPIGHKVSEDMPESKTHPYFPDHIWPYPVLTMAVLFGLGLMALIGRPLLESGQPADPRAAIIPLPEWYLPSSGPGSSRPGGAGPRSHPVAAA